MDDKETKDMKVRDLDRIYLRMNAENRCLTDCAWKDVEAWAKDSMQNRTPEMREAFLLAIAKHLHERLRFLGDHLDISPIE